MFADEALDTVSVQSLWRKSHEAAQESVSLGSTESAPPQNSVSLDSDVFAVYSCRILVGSEANFS